MWCRLSYIPVPKRLYDPPGNRAPFAVGYNSDPARSGDHESMNGTIAAVKVFNSALSERKLTGFSGVAAARSTDQPRTITVNVDKKIGRVHPYVFGTF